MIEINKIYCEDCLDTMVRMQDKSIDLIVTDPPYGVDKAEWDVEFPTFWIEEALRISKRMLLMPGNLALAKACKLFEKDYKDQIILRSKNGMTKSKIAFGNYIPVLAIGEWKWKARPNYIEFIVSTEEKIKHPSPKPKQAIIKLLKYYLDDAELIYDPFIGSGTTAIAAVYHKVKYIGSEKEKIYCDEAEKRINYEKSKLKLDLQYE